MDSTSKNMYDTFKDEIWKELGPLDPNWFEVLTAQSSADEEELCANQEGHFKAVSDKTEVESQLFSTPKVFSRRRIVSSPPVDEQSFTTDQEKGTLPWTATQSPQIFPISKQGVVDIKYGGIQPRSHMSFDLLRTPQKSPTSYARHISESLGAQINPDLSWTSSLNTPPAVPSTLILSKNDRTSPCPVSISAEKDVVFVRKLFPSLSNPSAPQVVVPQNNEVSTVQRGVVSAEVESVDSPSQSDGVWRQKLPDAIEDGEIRSTVSNVLAGAENVLSIFFANSSSSLRKVRHDRVRPKQIFENRQVPSSADAPTVNDGEPSKHRRDDQKTQSVSSEADHGLSQWSPLSLSEIPSSQTRSDSDGVVRPPAGGPASGRTKKARRFIYTIAASKPRVESRESGHPMVDSGQHWDVKLMSEPPGSSSEETALQQSRVAQENLPPPEQAKDLDMSQLCKEFAQDFSPTSDSGHAGKVPEDAQRHFSPLACLSAVKEAKQRKRREVLPVNSDDVSNRKTSSLANELFTADEGVTVDSGFQSALADITPVPTSVLPSCSENVRPNLLCSRGDFYGTSSCPSTKKEDENVNIDAAAETKVCRMERLTQDPRKKTDGQNLTASRRLSTSATANNNHYNLLTEELWGHQHEKTSRPPPSLHTSGFKTASNKGIHISSANLERAKLLFQDTESGNTLNHQPDKSNSSTEKQTSRIHKSECVVSHSNRLPSSEGLVDTSCQLTESQKADVTELCTLLEEAESQFEFTQFRAGETNSPGGVAPPPKPEKEVDVDLLTGIDFDDSFPSDVDRHAAPAGTPDIIVTNQTKCGAPHNPGESQSVSDARKKIHSRHEAVKESEGRTSDDSSEKLNLHSAGKTEMSKVENKHPSTFGVAFKSASGNTFTVSKAHLSKARALFADLEKLIDDKSSDGTKYERIDSVGGSEDPKVNAHLLHPHSEEMSCNCRRVSQKETSGCGTPSSTSPPCSSKPCAASIDGSSSAVVGLSEADGFRTASGKKVTVSSESVKRAEHVLNERCAPEDGQEESTGRAGQTSAVKGASMMRECRQVEDDFSEKPQRSPVKGGFVSASGKPVALSSAALLKAEALFSDMDTKGTDNKQGRGEKTKQIYPDLKAPEEGNVQGSRCGLINAKPAAPVSSELCVDSNSRAAANPGKNKRQKKTLQELKTDPSVAAHIPGEPGNGSVESMDEQVKRKAETSAHQGGSFQTASGKSIPVSSGALRKAKTLLSEVEGDVGVSTPRSAVPGPSSRNGGFMAASGKRVAVSSEAFRRAKALFSDISVGFNIQDASDKSKSDEEDGEKVHGPQEKLLKELESVSTDIIIKHPDIEGRKEIHAEEKECVSGNPPEPKPDQPGECGDDSTEDGKRHEKKTTNTGGGFQTASGKDVAVSSEALRKAKTLLGEEEEIRRRPTHYASPLAESPPAHVGFVAASGKPVAVSSEALRRAKVLFSDVDLSENIRTSSDAKTSGLKPDVGCGFKTARGQKVQVSPKSLLKAKRLFKGFDEAVGTKVPEEAECLSVRQEDGGPSVTSSGGKSPEAGPSTEVPEEEPEHYNKRLKPQAHTLHTQSDGFHTASGKEVTVSSEALWKAKTLLSKCDDDEEEAAATAPHFQVPGPSSWTCGFQAASGRKVCVSSEAVQRARALFCDVSLDFQTGSDARASENKTDGENPERVRGFTTAGGAKVHVCPKSLLKAKCVLEDPSLMERRDPGRFTQWEKNTPASECDASGHTPLTSAQRNQTAGTWSGCFRKDEANEDGIKRRDGGAAANLRLSSGRDKANALNRDGSRPECGKDSPLLSFQSLHLTGCSETQQDFLAREAIDCTEALLQDEGLAGRGFPAASDFTPQPEDSRKKSSNGSDEREKRALPLCDLPDDGAPPPLKRRLIEEFDETVDGLRSSALQPMRSCPNVLKDRGAFKYGVSLHPNITRPDRSAKSCVEHKRHGTRQTSTSANSKVPAFVPPFVKKSQRDPRGNMAVKEKTTAPAFVPPFKKQRAHVDENSECQREDKDEEPRSFVPPAKRTDRSKDTSTPTDSTTNDDDLGVTSGSARPDIQVLSTSEDSSVNFDPAELARDVQDMRIRKKKRQTVRPQPGSLFLRKTSGVPRIPLKAAVRGSAPGRHSPEELYGYGVHRHVSEITSGTAESFRFNLLQFIRRDVLVEGGGVQLADGGWLVPGNDGTAGKEEFYRALCDTPGVDPKLLSEAWAFNHYRWIVWKQASMEKAFPETMGSLCLTPEQVLLQLKYRYDVEVDHSHRPALRKILEKDDTSAKTLVLCVSEVVSWSRSLNTDGDAKTPQGGDTKVQTPPAVVRLTDGWYSVKAQLDEPLTAMLRRGRLAVGGKLIVSGAQLLGAQDACPPLEAPESVVLKIGANSCRPARWAVRLGFYKDPRPFRLSVSSLFHNGGPVGCVDIVVLRSYPMQWMERKADGGVVFRSVRAEEKEARRYNGHKQRSMEALVAKIQDDFEREEKEKIKPRRRPRSYQDLGALQEGEELYDAVGDDPADLEAHLSADQLEALHTYRRSVMEKRRRELQDRFHRALEADDGAANCPKRDVTPVWRLCVADSLDQTNKVYQLNLWRPSSDLQSLLKEGGRYRVYNLTTCEGKKRSGIENLQLTATKKTQFQDLQASSDWLSARFQPRVASGFVDLQYPDYQPLCGEVDVTGYVIRVTDEQGSSPALYLVDGELNFVKVRCFSSFSHSGIEDVVKPSVLLAVSNLQLRGQSASPTPVVYAGDLTVFSANPKEVHLQESLGKIKTHVQCQGRFFQAAEERLSLLIRSGTSSGFAAAPQQRTPTTDTSTRVASHTGARSLGSFTPVSRNPGAASSSSEKDPRMLKRKRALEYLSHMPSPPPLSHLNCVASSPRVKKTFNPPRRSGTPGALKTPQSPAPKATASLQGKGWVNDEELVMIDTQALHLQ